MFDSAEEINDDETLSNGTISAPSSLLEKSMIFCKIENTLFEDKIESLQEQLKFTFVLSELKVHYIQRKYQRKLYDVVMMQLLKDKTKLWYNLINSF